MQRFPGLIVAFLLLFCNLVFSQNSFNPFITGTDTTSLYNSSFDKLLHTTNFNTVFKYSKNINSFNFRLMENYNSTIIQSSLKNIKDDHQLNFLMNYNLNEYFKPGILIHNNVYSDDRNLSINNSLKNKALLTLESNLNKNIKLFSYGGYSQNKQLNENDKGYNYGGIFRLNNINFEDFIINAEINFDKDKISPRNNFENSYNFEIFNEFNRDINNKISLSFYNNNKDLYFEADSSTQDLFNINSNIKSREEKVYKLSDKIIYLDLLDNFSLTLLGSAKKRQIYRTTKYNIRKGTINDNDEKIEETNLEFSGNLNYRNKNLHSKVNIAYEESEENYYPINLTGINLFIDENRKSREKEKNNKSKILSSQISSVYRINKKNFLTADFNYRKLVYDTPSEKNFDDRDELLAILKLGYHHIFSRFFSGYLNLEGSTNHVVYIFGERSSNNNFQRNIKLTTGGRFKSEKFSSSYKTEVLANYTVYDFDELTPETKSFSFRQMSIADSTSYIINDLVKISFSGYMKFSEQGQLNWNTFAGKPIRYLSEFNFEPNVVILNNYFEISLGYRYFQLNTYNYVFNEKKLNDKYTSKGPIIKINRNTENLILNLYTYLERISTLNSGSNIVNFNLNVSWKF